MRDSASAAKFPKWTPIPTQRRLFPFVLPPPSFFSYRSSPGILHHPSGNAESTVQWRSNQRAVSLSNPINSQARHPRCLATATLFWIVSSVICWCSGWVTRQWFYFLDFIYLLFFFFFFGRFSLWYHPVWKNGDRPHGTKSTASEHHQFAVGLFFPPGPRVSQIEEEHSHITQSSIEENPIIQPGPSDIRAPVYPFGSPCI